jgi:hypothetical protein
MPIPAIPIVGICVATPAGFVAYIEGDYLDGAVPAVAADHRHPTELTMGRDEDTHTGSKTTRGRSWSTAQIFVAGSVAATSTRPAAF